MSLAFRRFVFAVFALVFALSSSNALADGMPKKKAAHKRHAVHKKHSAAVKKARKAKKTTAHVGHPEYREHMPPPGHDGQERNDWFYRKRAWPKENIDPGYYPEILAQAAKMPTYRKQTLYGTLSVKQWQCIGPYSIDGRVSALATHPTDSNIFYAGAAAGGLWKTTDHGHSWRCLTDTFGALATGAIALDSTDPNIIYLGTGEANNSLDSYPGNGIWKTIDGGGTWTPVGLEKSQYISKIIFDPHDHNTLYVAVLGPASYTDTNRGVWKTTNGGSTWSRILFVRAGKSNSSPSVGFVDVAVNPLNSAQVVAYASDKSTPYGANYTRGAAGAYSGVYRSSDSGRSWVRCDTLANSGLPNASKMRMLSRGALLWTAVNAGEGYKDYLFTVYSRADTNLVTHIASDANMQGVYRSSDQGLTWTKILDSTYRIPMGHLRGRDSADFFNAQGDYDIFFVSSPTPKQVGAPRIYIGGIDVIESTDLGDSWTNITKSYSEYYVKSDRRQHSDQHALTFSAASNDLLVGSDGGVFHTDDYGKTWDQMVGLPITQFYSVDVWRGGMKNTPAQITAQDLKVFGGTQDNGTVGLGMTADTGFAWINHADGMNVWSHPTDSNKLISSMQFGGIFARNTLDSLKFPLPLEGPDTMHDLRPRWHTLTNRLLYGTTAITDTQEAVDWTVPIVLDDDDPTQLYTARCHVYHAVLNWNDLEDVKWYSWSPILAGNSTNDSAWNYGDVAAMAIGPKDQNGHPMLWAGGYDYGAPATRLWRTLVDPARAETTAPKWLAISKGLPSGFISDIKTDRSDSLTAFVSNSSASKIGHIYKTIDGGKTWTNISGNLPQAPISAFEIDTVAEHGDPTQRNMTLFAATDVGVFVTTNGGTAWYNVGDAMPHIVVSDIKLYKNMLIAATQGRSLYAIDVSDVQAAINADVATNGNSKSVRVYPNPARESFSIDGVANNITTCRFVDLESGKQFERTVNGASSIQTEGIPTGSYAIVLLKNNTIVARTQVTIVK